MKLTQISEGYTKLETKTKCTKAEEMKLKREKNRF